MTPEIRERIEQIRHGNVPDGYIKVETATIPDKWREVTFGDVINVFRGASPRPKGDPQYYGGSIPRLLIEDLTRDGKYAIPQIDFLTEEGAQKSRLLPKGSLVMSCSGTRVGIIGFLGVDACIHDGFFGFNGYKGIAPEYLYQYFQLISQSLQSSATRGGIFNNLTTDIMKTMKCCFPPIDEQHKIVKILIAQDNVIELKEKQLAEKQRQKKYLMQQLLTGKQRLLGFDEDWKIAPIGKFLESRNTKQMPSEEAPLMAFVAGEGVTSKGEKYDRSHLVKEDTKKYKRTELNDFIYSSNNLDVGSIGLNKYGTAVISVVYEVFKAKEKVVPVVISEIIQLPRNLHYILSYRQGAFYGQYRIFAEDFLSVPIKVPCYEEQVAIGAVLNAADKEIDLLRQDLEQEKQKKKALMQLLLTGIVRVNA